MQIRGLIGGVIVLSLSLLLGACGSSADERDAALSSAPDEVVTTPSTATEEGKPQGLPEPPAGFQALAPPEEPPPPPEPTRPKRIASPLSKVVQLRKRRIAVPLACRAPGTVGLRAGSLALGRAGYECSDFTGVATVRVPAAVARRIESAKRRPRGLPITARIDGQGESISARLRLGVVRPTGAGKAAGLYWTTGWLSCGRPDSYVPGLRFHTPTVSSAGQRTDAWFNASAQQNWVTYMAWLYTYGVGWRAYGWHGWISVPPWGSIWDPSNSPGIDGHFIANPPQGQKRYVGAALQIYWWNGFRDWNYLNASWAQYSYPVVDRFWCYVA